LHDEFVSFWEYFPIFGIVSGVFQLLLVFNRIHFYWWKNRQLTSKDEAELKLTLHENEL
jgi:hypothetical protein